jgi:hypothetical protein
VASPKPERRARVNCIVRVGGASVLNNSGMEVVQRRRVSALYFSRTRFQLDLILS